MLRASGREIANRPGLCGFFKLARKENVLTRPLARYLTPLQGGFIREDSR